MPHRGSWARATIPARTGAGPRAGDLRRRRDPGDGGGGTLLRRSPLFGLGLILLAGCGSRQAPAATARVDTLPSGTLLVTSDGPTGWRDSSRAWQVVETLRIQPPEGSPGELVEPFTLAADGAGRIYVADQKPVVIKVFDTAGVLARTIGREGAGPGEFQVAFIALNGPNLVVQDPSQSRASVFDTSGSFVRSWTSSCCIWGDIAVDTAGRISIPTMVTPDSGKPRRGQAYSRYRVDGGLIDTLFVPERSEEGKVWRFTRGPSTRPTGMMMMSVPYAASMTSSQHPAGGFVRGWTGEYRIVRSPLGEDSSMVMTRPWTADPIPEAMRLAQVEQAVRNAKDMVGEAAAREAARLSDIPTLAPAYQSLRVDLDGNVWARRLVGSDSTRTLYDVFAPDGAWLGPVVVPVALPRWGALFFGHGVIYSAVEDADGRPAIVRLELRRKA